MSDTLRPPLPTAPNPWRIRASDVKMETPWLRVKLYDVINPAGEACEYGVAHFKNKAIGVVPYAQGHIWMVGQTRFTLNQYSWEIVEGGCPAGETPHGTAIRELKEEAGITAQNLTPLFEMHLSNSCTDEWGQVFLATGLSFGEQELENSEDITLRKFSLDEVYAYVEAGEITDSLTVTTIYKLMLMRAQGSLPT